jgi:hypothetical protein
LKTFHVILLTATAIVSSCSWFDQSSHERIVGEYIVGWSDLEQNRSITKPIKDCSGCFEVVVSNYIYAVGHNDNFIIAKQHFSPNTTKTYYYVIDIKKNGNSNGTKGVYEFLDERSFESFRNRLNISNIPFNMNYAENP